MRNLAYFLLALLSVIVVACKKHSFGPDDGSDIKVECVTGEATDIYPATAKLTGTVSITGAKAGVEPSVSFYCAKVSVGAEGLFVADNGYKVTKIDGEVLSVSVIGLSPETEYQYVIAVTIGGESYYGQIKTFITRSKFEGPAVTGPVLDDGSGSDSSVIISGYVDDDGNGGGNSGDGSGGNGGNGGTGGDGNGGGGGNNNDDGNGGGGGNNNDDGNGGGGGNNNDDGNGGGGGNNNDDGNGDGGGDNNDDGNGGGNNNDDGNGGGDGNNNDDGNGGGDGDNNDGGNGGGDGDNNDDNNGGGNNNDDGNGGGDGDNNDGGNGGGDGDNNDDNNGGDDDTGGYDPGTAGVILSLEKRPSFRNGTVYKADRIDENGHFIIKITDKLLPATTYYYVVFYISANGISYGQVKSFTTPGIPEGYSTADFVDLGLSVLWATRNLGASAPEEYGDYYAWGELSPKASYTENNYQYNAEVEELPLGRDVAYTTLGEKWRIPSLGNWDELLQNCSFSWGAGKGCTVRSNINGKEIFLPAAGVGYETSSRGITGFYWSSTNTYVWSAGFPPYELSYDRAFNFVVNGQSGAFIGRGSRYGGMSIRPVREKIDSRH